MCLLGDLLLLSLFFSLLTGFVHAFKSAHHGVKMRDICSDSQSREIFTSCSVTDISRNRSDYLDSVSVGQMKDRTSADSINGNAINQVGMTPFLSGTDSSRKETLSPRSNSRESKPSNLGSDREQGTVWEQWYDFLWKIKMANGHQNNR